MAGDVPAKVTCYERILGQRHEHVMAHLIGFPIGGPVDLFVFPNHMPRTVLGTMQVISPDGTAPKRNKVGVYELVGAIKPEIYEAPPSPVRTPRTRLEKNTSRL